MLHLGTWELRAAGESRVSTWNTASGMRWSFSHSNDLRRGCTMKMTIVGSGKPGHGKDEFCSERTRAIGHCVAYVAELVVQVEESLL